MQLLTRKFTVNDYHKMGEVGILTPEDHEVYQNPQNNIFESFGFRQRLNLLLIT